MKETGTIQTMALGSSVVQSFTSSAIEETMPMAEKLDIMLVRVPIDHLLSSLHIRPC
jgi:hypothetical protein